MPASGPRGIGLVVPDDDRIVGPAFAFRREVDDAAFQERWRPHSARWTFIAHPQHPEALLRFMASPEVRDMQSGPWRLLERAFLLDPAQLEHVLSGFLDLGRWIWLIPESVAVRAERQSEDDRGDLYGDMLAYCLPVGMVTEETLPRSVEEALRQVEYWRRRGNPKS
jgi:hypothetical protein